MVMQKYTKCIDQYKYKCRCGSRKAIKESLTHYCPVNVTLDTYARIVFDYYPNGSNSTALMTKLQQNHEV